MTDDTTPDAALTALFDRLEGYEGPGAFLVADAYVALRDLTARAVAAEKRATELETLILGGGAEGRAFKAEGEVTRLQGVVERVREWHATLKSQRLYDELGDVLAAPEKEGEQ